MASLNLVEKIVKGFLEKDNKLVISLLESEADKLKKSNRKKSYMEIKKLIKKIPLETKELSGTTIKSRRYDQDINYFASNSSNKFVNEYYSKILAEEVILNEDSKKIISSFFREWENKDKLEKHNLFPVNKIILYGKPGTGKTLLAHAIANKLDLPIAIIKLDELISSYLGNTGKNLRDIFKIAEEKEIVLFLDEFDTIGKFRSDSKELGELKRIVTVLLQNIDNFSQRSILVAATNHEELLDKAIWRRFPLKVEMDLPEEESIKKMLRKYFLNHRIKIDENKISSLFKGLSGSDIKNLCEFTIREKILLDKKDINTVDLVSAYLMLHKDQDKTEKYEACKILLTSGIKMRVISEISNIPYTTLRDNLK